MALLPDSNMGEFCPHDGERQLTNQSNLIEESIEGVATVCIGLNSTPGPFHVSCSRPQLLQGVPPDDPVANTASRFEMKL